MQTTQAESLRIEHVSIATLKGASYNPRTWDTQATKDLKESIVKYGIVDPLLLRGDLFVLPVHIRAVRGLEGASAAFGASGGAGENRHNAEGAKQQNTEFDLPAQHECERRGTPRLSPTRKNRRLLVMPGLAG